MEFEVAISSVAADVGTVYGCSICGVSLCVGQLSEDKFIESKKYVCFGCCPAGRLERLC